MYAIVMDIGRDEIRPELRQRMLLFGAVTYASGKLGDEPVRSQGHVHRVSSHSGWRPPEVYEIWEGAAYVYMQERAAEDPGRRFGDLFNLVYDPLFLAEAWLRVSGNDGKRTPGIDKATVASIENGIGAGAFLEEIRGLLKSGEFRPVPVRQVMIPKKSGKLRKLGIPTEAA